MNERILFFDEGIDFCLADEADVCRWIHQIVAAYHRKIESLNFIFCSDEFLLKLNQEHLEHDYYTDILTFQYHEVESPLLQSDIYISIERVRENAEDLLVSFEDELARVMIHGVLHLMGFDDHFEEDQERMREAENAALAKR